MGPPGSVGPVGPSGLPVRMLLEFRSTSLYFRVCWVLKAMKVHPAPEASKEVKEMLELLDLRV